MQQMFMMLLQMFLLSTSAPNLTQLAPLIVIVVLILAAAGLSRGMDIFAVFGVGSLLSVTSGIGAGGAGKGFGSARMRSRTKAMVKNAANSGAVGLAVFGKKGVLGAAAAGKALVGAKLSAGRQANIEKGIALAEKQGYGKGVEAVVNKAMKEGTLSAHQTNRLLGAIATMNIAQARVTEARANIEKINADIQAQGGKATWSQRIALRNAQQELSRGFDPTTGKPSSRPWIVVPIVRIPVPSYHRTGALADAAIASIALEKALASAAKSMINQHVEAGGRLPPATPPPMLTRPSTPPPMGPTSGSKSTMTFPERIRQFSGVDSPSEARRAMAPFMADIAGVYAVGLMLARPILYLYQQSYFAGSKRAETSADLNRTDIVGRGVPSIAKELASANVPGGSYAEAAREKAETDPRWEAVVAHWDTEKNRRTATEEERQNTILNQGYMRYTPDLFKEGDDERRKRIRKHYLS